VGTHRDEIGWLVNSMQEVSAMTGMHRLRQTNQAHRLLRILACRGDDWITGPVTSGVRFVLSAASHIRRDSNRTGAVRVTRHRDRHASRRPASCGALRRGSHGVGSLPQARLAHSGDSPAGRADRGCAAAIFGVQAHWIENVCPWSWAMCPTPLGIPSVIGVCSIGLGRRQTPTRRG
jgi:hypothetical protein